MAEGSDSAKANERPNGSANKRIALEGDDVVFHSDGQIVWKLPVASVALAGEYTTLDGGPADDDYYLVFLSSEDQEWRTASFRSEGVAEFLAALGERLGAKLAAGGLDSKTYASRVIWPPNMEGDVLFEIVPKGAKGLLDFLKRSFFDRH